MSCLFADITTCRRDLFRTHPPRNICEGAPAPCHLEAVRCVLQTELQYIKKRRGCASFDSMALLNVEESVVGSVLPLSDLPVYLDAGMPPYLLSVASERSYSLQFFTQIHYAQASTATSPVSGARRLRSRLLLCLTRSFSHARSTTLHHCHLVFLGPLNVGHSVVSLGSPPSLTY